MAIQSLGRAFGYLIRTPLVWLSGVATAAILALGWYLYTNVGMMTAISVVFVLAFLLPALISGTYGIVAENSTSFALFRKYAVQGYFRCLLPTLLTFLIAYVIAQFISYILMIAGVGTMMSVQISTFVFIPVIFFCYFADVSAVVNKLRMFQSLKDSFLRVINGSFSVAVFYLVNVIILLTASFCGSFLWASIAAEQITPLAAMTESEILALTTDQLIALFSTPEMIFSAFTTLALCGLVLVPLLTVYKACYFTKTSVFELPQMEVAQGSYDEKGRWYKYD